MNGQNSLSAQTTTNRTSTANKTVVFAASVSSKSHAIMFIHTSGR